MGNFLIGGIFLIVKIFLIAKIFLNGGNILTFFKNSILTKSKICKNEKTYFLIYICAHSLVFFHGFQLEKIKSHNRNLISFFPLTKKSFSVINIDVGRQNQKNPKSNTFRKGEKSCLQSKHKKLM